MLAIEKKPVKEIAAKLNQSPNTVKQSKFRVLQRLRQEIEAWEQFGAVTPP